MFSSSLFLNFFCDYWRTIKCISPILFEPSLYLYLDKTVNKSHKHERPIKIWQNVELSYVIVNFNVICEVSYFNGQRDSGWLFVGISRPTKKITISRIFLYPWYFRTNVRTNFINILSFQRILNIMLHIHAPYPRDSILKIDL